MCFSATASFVSGGVLAATGTAILPFVRRPRELPLALLGLGFAGHQLLEGVIWGQVAAAGEDHVRSPAVGLWLLYAWVLLPVWVPAAIRLVEPDPGRRRAMTGLLAIGAAVATVLGAVAVLTPAGASTFGGHLEYVVFSRWVALCVVPYVAVTCGAPLLSTRPVLRLWGVALAVAMAASALIQARAFDSIWCFFAALLSVLLLVHHVRERSTGRTLAPAPAR